MEIIKIRATMSDPTGRLIPRGIQAKLTVEIADEVAVYYFMDRNITKRFAMIEIKGDEVKKLPQTTFYMERNGKAIKRYEHKTKEEIRDLILEQFKQLNMNVKPK